MFNCSPYKKYALWIAALAVFLSRLPFIGVGAGADEDAWGVALNMLHIVHTGSYDVSRLPGFPVQDFLYLPFYQYAPYSYNLINAFFSVLAFVCFALSLKEMGILPYIKAALTLVFVPVVYIASCNSMDYMLALGFAMGALYVLLKKKPITAGILLGLAIGSRITTGALLAPIALLLYNRISLRLLARFVLVACITGALLFIPVMSKYGWAFFNYYVPPQQAGLLKALYKATFGVLGVVGLFSLLLAGAISVIKCSTLDAQPSTINYKLAAWAVVVLYGIAYWRLPQEAGYLIPALPFLIMLACIYFTGKAFQVFFVGMLLSSWFFSISKYDIHGGPSPSNYAHIVSIGGQETITDPFVGPVVAEYQKQVSRNAFVNKVMTQLRVIKRPTVLICGWWYNQLTFQLGEEKLPNVVLAYYLNEQEMKHYIQKGLSIYYLPEQVFYNNIRYKQSCTAILAAPFE